MTATFRKKITRRRGRGSGGGGCFEENLGPRSAKGRKSAFARKNQRKRKKPISGSIKGCWRESKKKKGGYEQWVALEEKEGKNRCDWKKKEKGRIWSRPYFKAGRRTDLTVFLELKESISFCSDVVVRRRRKGPFLIERERVRGRGGGNGSCQGRLGSFVSGQEKGAA